MPGLVDRLSSLWMIVAAGVVSTDHSPKRACLVTAVTDGGRSRWRLALFCFGRFRTTPLGSHPMRLHRSLIAALLVMALSSALVRHGDVAAGSGPLPRGGTAKDNDIASASVVKPYLQLGDAPRAGVNGDLVLLWHAENTEADWEVEYQPGPNQTWRDADAPTMRRIAVPTIATHRVYRAALNDLAPGATFAYRVRRGGEVVFSADGHAPKGSGQPYRFVVFGDCGAGTPEQKAIAYQTYLARPDFVMITGDIVYSRGQISEYRAKFWPFYNAEEASPLLGAPCLRSTLFVACAGQPRYRDSRPGEVPRRPCLLPVLGPTQERPTRYGGECARAGTQGTGGKPGGVPRGGRRGLPRNGKLLFRLRQCPLDDPRFRTHTSTGPIASSGRGSSVIWLPRETPPGGSSPSTTPVSTRPSRTSATSRCACWPMFSKKAT